MKRIWMLFCLLPFAVNAQTDDTTCKLDMFGCYAYALKALANGNAGLKNMHKQLLNAKGKDIYLPAKFYTGGLPEKVDKYTYHFANFDDDINTVFTEVQSKKAATIYMTELSIASDTCNLWLMPIALTKQDGNIEMEYPEKGCKLMFKVNKETGKLCYARTHCPPADKED